MECINSEMAQSIVWPGSINNTSSAHTALMQFWAIECFNYCATLGNGKQAITLETDLGVHGTTSQVTVANYTANSRAYCSAAEALLSPWSLTFACHMVHCTHMHRHTGTLLRPNYSFTPSWTIKTAACPGTMINLWVPQIDILTPVASVPGRRLLLISLIKLLSN